MTSTRANRRRRGIEVTVSPEAEAAWRRMASVHPSRTLSAVVEDLLLAADARHGVGS